MESHIADIDGPVHYVDFGGEGRPIVLVHGLGGNHANWRDVAPMLAERGRVLAVDLPGFGRTAPHGRSASVHANRAVLSRFLGEVAGAPAVLVGNSMGGLLSIMQASREPDSVAAVVLANPAIPRPPTMIGDPRIVFAFGMYALPYAGEALVARRARKLGPEGMVRETIKVCTVDPSRVSAETVDALIEIARWRLQHPWAGAAYLQAARSLVSVVTRRAAFTLMARAVAAPTLLLHGREDRLVPHAAARDLVSRLPDWDLDVIADCGHVPMLEKPAEVAGRVLAWLDRQQTLRPAG